MPSKHSEMTVAVSVARSLRRDQGPVARLSLVAPSPRARASRRPRAPLEAEVARRGRRLRELCVRRPPARSASRLGRLGDLLRRSGRSSRAAVGLQDVLVGALHRLGAPAARRTKPQAHASVAIAAVISTVEHHFRAVTDLAAVCKRLSRAGGERQYLSAAAAAARTRLATDNPEIGASVI